MKISTGRSNSTRGTVLAVTLLSCSILGIMMGSYLSLVMSEQACASRSQAWNRAIVVAEGGVEEAMAHLNSGVRLDLLGVNSWTSVGAGSFSKRSTLSDGYADVTIITTNPSNPVILSTASVGGPLSGPQLSRTIRVVTRPKTLGAVPGAMVVTSKADLTGYKTALNSFNSSDPNHSTGGMYDPLKAKDNGDICTTSSDANALSLGNAKIAGSVHTNQGGQAAVGANGSVGDMSYVTSGQTGFQTGHVLDDMTSPIPDVELPNLAWLPPVPGTSKINGHTYKYVLDMSGGYTLDSLIDSVYVSATNTILYVTSDIKISSKDLITIAPGASLTLYMAGPSATFSGNGIVNQSGYARNFVYLGLPSNTQIAVSANCDITGDFYAPEASFQLGGGGKTAYDFVGKSVTKSAKMNGNYNLHYDESLGVGIIINGYVATSWDEL
jgi:hypothetical protein